MSTNNLRENVIRRFISTYRYLGVLPATYDGETSPVKVNNFAYYFMWIIILSKFLSLYFMFKLLLFVNSRPGNTWSDFMFGLIFIMQFITLFEIQRSSKTRVKILNEILMEIRKIDKLFNFTWSVNRYVSMKTVMFTSIWGTHIMLLVYELYLFLRYAASVYIVVILWYFYAMYALVRGFEWTIITQLLWLLIRMEKAHKKLKQVYNSLDYNETETIDMTLKLLRITNNLARRLSNKCGVPIIIDALYSLFSITIRVFLLVIVISKSTTNDTSTSTLILNFFWIVFNIFNFIIFLKPFTDMEYKWLQILRTVQDLITEKISKRLLEGQVLCRLERAVSLIGVIPLQFVCYMDTVINNKLLLMMTTMYINFLFITIQIQYQLI